ncbi:MAG: hypothetical protein ABUL68_03865 [Pseudomonadota bacterium]
MKRQHEQITPDRLVDAASAVLEAVADVREQLGEVAFNPVDLMGLPDQPRCLCDFTKWEVAEATAFLVRMGYLERA